MLWLRALGSWVRGLLFNQRTRLVKRPSGEGNIEQRLQRNRKKNKAEKKMQRQRGMNWYAVF